MEIFDKSTGEYSDELYESKASVWADLRGLLEFVYPSRGILAFAFALGIGSSLATLAQPLVVRAVLNAISAGQSIGWPVMVLITLFAADAGLAGLRQYLLGKTGEGVVLGIRLSLIDHLMRLPVGTHNRYRTGDVLSRVGTDTILLREVLTSGILNALTGSLTLVGAVILMAWVDWQLLVVAILAVLLATSVVVLVSSKIRETSEAAQTSLGRLTATLERALRAVKTVKASRAECKETENIAKEASVAYSAGVRTAKLEAWVFPASAIAIQGSFLLVLGLGGYRIASGSITAADLVAFVLYLFFLILPLIQIFQFLTDLQKGLGAASRVGTILAEPTEPAGTKHFRIGATRQYQCAKAPIVQFESVTFGYHEGLRTLEEVSFEIPEGSKTALIGPSGAGKSTVFSLLERFYEVNSGMIFFRGADINSVPIDVLRGSIGYVEQESPTMAGSIRSNLLYACQDEPAPERLERVLESTNLLSFIERLPEGLETEVGDSGVLLSGGERQRIAIARALLSQPQLLLLDEATSQLDAINELALQQTLSRIAQMCTVIVIAHRLSTVVDADQIIMLDKGRVVNVGTHASLLDHDPTYQELVRNQLVKTFEPQKNTLRGC